MPARLVPGDAIEVTIEKGVYRGLGLARHEGQVVFVPRGLPGERLRVRVASVERGYVRAVAVDKRAPSPLERPSPCGFFPRCGGCAYQHLDHAAELRMKEEILRESLQRAHATWDSPISVHASPERGWRTRATFHVEVHGTAVGLGLYEEGSRRVVDLDGECLQASSGMNATMGHLRVALGARPALAAHVTDVHIAESPDGAERVAWFEGNIEAHEAAALGAVASDAPWLTGVGVAVGSGATRQQVIVRGSPYLHTEVLGLRLRAHALSFFQGNRFLVGPLAAEVARLTTGPGPLLDLYGGVGLFGLTAGDSAGPVLLVESSETAASDAQENARGAKRGDLRVVRGTVESALSERRGEPGERIILDPPRAGAGKAVVSAIAARRPDAIVYVSCEPTTLGRDLSAFARLGYRVDSVGLFDLFPGTVHLETVVRLLPS
ncbi:MAG: 23S rRNA (uracil(1939)-C(5))-methyltransferase RlmD [Vicinamibacteria bacterium]